MSQATKGMRKTIHKGKNDAKGRGFSLYRSTMRFAKNKARKLRKLIKQHPNNLELQNCLHRLETGNLLPRCGFGQRA